MEHSKDYAEFDKDGSSNNAMLMPIAKVTDNFFGIGRWGTPEKVADLMADEKCYFDYFGRSRMSIRVSGKGREPVLVENCFISLEEVEGVTCRETIGFFDLLVFSAYCYLLDSGEESCTPQQILRVMNGGRRSRSSESVGSREVECSMDKMRRAIIMLDWTNQAAAWGDKVDMDGVESFQVETYLIPAEKITKHFNNGVKSIAYKSMEYPELYRYIRAIRQFITVREDVLNIDIYMTHRNMLIRGYLIRKIEQLRSLSARKNRGSESNDSILFSTMIDKLELTVNSRKMEKAIKDTTCKILDCFKDKKYIIDYELVKESSGKIRSVRIIV